MKNIDLLEVSKDIRKTIINMAYRAKSPHVGSCLSCVEILTALYFDTMRIEPWEERDIFVLSKGHAAMCLYATLALRGIIDKSLLDGYYQNDGTLPAHLDRFSVRGIEVSAGSLGHGFNIGIGMALGFKRRNNKRKVYTVIGDGESEEGSIWEGALFTPKLGIDNFTAIIDYNNLQGYGCPRNICAYEPIKAKWEAFGWYAIEVNGHDFKEIQSALRQDSVGKPKIIIAHTVKGKGISFMENRLEWHYFIISDKDKEKALHELE